MPGIQGKEKMMNTKTEGNTFTKKIGQHPVVWNIPTKILYGDKDNLTSYETMSDFASKMGISLTVMNNGEHWFHTDEQMNFLDDWICESNR